MRRNQRVCMHIQKKWTNACTATISGELLVSPCKILEMIMHQNQISQTEYEIWQKVRYQAQICIMSLHPRMNTLCRFCNACIQAWYFDANNSWLWIQFCVWASADSNLMQTFSRKTYCLEWCSGLHGRLGEDRGQCLSCKWFVEINREAAKFMPSMITKANSARTQSFLYQGHKAGTGKVSLLIH